jgi:hypothetical protein
MAHLHVIIDVKQIARYRLVKNSFSLVKKLNLAERENKEMLMVLED